MDFNEIGERNWKAMPPLERMAVLDVLMAGTEWADSTLIVAQIPSFDDLPSEVRGRLILAMTETGFDVEEYKRVTEKRKSWNT